jgi:uncharacterized membrane protein
MILAIVLASTTAILKSAERVVHRYVLADEDSVSYAFVYQLLAAIYLIPFALSATEFPTSLEQWAYIIISSLLWSLIAYFGFKAYSHLEVSIKSPINKSRVIMSFILAIVILKETLTVSKVLGVTLIFIGILVVSYKKRKKFGSLTEPGVIYTLLSALFTSFVLIIDSVGSKLTDPGVYAFFVYLIPAIFLFIPAMKKKKQIKKILTNRFNITSLSVFLGAISYYLIILAFQYGEASVVIPISEASFIFSVLGGIIILKERKNIKRKLIGSGIIFIGTILVALSAIL